MEPPVKDERPINEMIQALVRLIGAEGEQIGVVTRDDALDRSANLGLDLVIVADNADPPSAKSWITASSNTKNRRKNEAGKTENHRR